MKEALDSKPSSLGLACGTLVCLTLTPSVFGVFLGLVAVSSYGGGRIACNDCLFFHPQNKSRSLFGQRSALTFRIPVYSVGPCALRGEDGSGREKFRKAMGFDLRRVACGFSGCVQASCRRPASRGWPLSALLSSPDISIHKGLLFLL